MRIKICGITLPEDAKCAEREGANAIGVVMFSDSPRSVSPETARVIFESVGPFTATVAVTHTKSQADLDKVLALYPTAIQIFHPFEFPDDRGIKVIRAIGRRDNLADDCDAIIIDESHGHGKTFDHSCVHEAIRKSRVPVILAGGLTPENVREAIR